MARLDKLIHELLREPGAQLVLETGAAATLYSPAGARQLMRQQLTTPQIVGVCAELVPPVQRARLNDAAPGEFHYAAPSGPVLLRFEALGARCRAVLVYDAPEQAAVAAANSEVERKTVQAPPAPEDAASAMRLLLDLMAQCRASDLHLQSAAAPLFRIDGDMVPMEGWGTLPASRLCELLFSIAPQGNRAQFEQLRDTDFAHETEQARYRVNLFADRMGIGGVLRLIPNEIRTASELGVPQAVVDLCSLSKGLVLVTGPTGSGKSTTLAALIDHVNRTRDDHIITIEDPIEFVHPNRRCLVNQREVGVHTSSFKHALRAALREDPDVVLVGELRDLETISIAIETAETGHLVFGTLHTNTAPSTVDRIIDQFPSDRQAQIRSMLGESLKGVVSQVLCKRIGGGRAAAQEVLIVSSAVSNLIREGKTYQIPSVMQTSRAQGMILMNDALLELVKGRQVTPPDALAKSPNKPELRAQIERAGFSVSAEG